MKPNTWFKLVPPPYGLVHAPHCLYLIHVGPPLALWPWGTEAWLQCGPATRPHHQLLEAMEQILAFTIHIPTRHCQRLALVLPLLQRA